MARRAIIVGGGIGGLAAAIALRQAGWKATVFERAAELREVGAGITLWTNAVKVLRKIDVGPPIETLATPLTRSEVRRWNGELLSEVNLAPICERLGAPTLGIHRADLLRALVEALPPDSLTLGAACVGFTQATNTVLARFSDGREESCEVLIGADGLRSVIRGQLLGPEKPRYSGYTAWRGVANHVRPEVPVGTTLLATGQGSQVGYLPIGGSRTYWFATANVPEGGADLAGRKKTPLLHRFAGWYPPIPTVIEATDDSTILRNDIVDRQPVWKWGEGRVTLLGDAAHPTTPNLGQGGCMAIEDALVLARCLKDATDLPAALRAYEAQRYERTAMITRTSWRVGRMLALESRFWCQLRDAAIRRFRESTIRQTEKVIGFEP